MSSSDTRAIRNSTSLNVPAIVGASSRPSFVHDTQKASSALQQLLSQFSGEYSPSLKGTNANAKTKAKAKAKANAKANTNTNANHDQYPEEKMSSNLYSSEVDLEFGWLMFMPGCKFLQIWNTLIVCVVIVNSITTPFELSFYSTNLIHENVFNVFWWKVVEVFMELIYIVDVLVNFRTAFVNERNVLVYDKKQIAINYIKTFFLPDIAASLPLETLSLISRNSNFLRSFKFMTMLKVFRVFRLTRISRTSNNYSVSFWSIAKLLVYYALVCHAVGCSWYVLSSSDEQHNWYLERDLLPSHGIFDQYIASIYAALLLVVGEEIEPTTENERLFALLTLFLGSFFFATIVGNITVMIQDWDLGASKFREKLRSVVENMQQMALPLELQQRVLRYYEYCWQRFRGVDINAFFGSEPCDLPLSPSLHAEISLHLFSELVEACPLFHDANPQFIYAIIMHLKLEVASPGDFIVQKGEIAEEMYFITRGRAAVMQNNKSGKISVLLEEGSFFGEIALCLGGTRTATVRALTFCELYVLTKKGFDQVCGDFPEEAAIIHDIARGRANQDLRAAVKQQKSLGVDHDLDTVFNQTITKHRLKDMKTLKASTAFIGSLERARNKKSDAQNLKELTVFEKREVSHVDESESNRRRSTVARRASMITGKNQDKDEQVESKTLNESLIQESQFTPMESLQKSTSKQFNLQDDEDSEKDVERQSESRNVSRNENCVQNTEKETEIAIVQPFENLTAADFDTTFQNPKMVNVPFEHMSLRDEIDQKKRNSITNLTLPENQLWARKSISSIIIGPQVAPKQDTQNVESKRSRTSPVNEKYPAMSKSRSTRSLLSARDINESFSLRVPVKNERISLLEHKVDRIDQKLEELSASQASIVSMLHRALEHLDLNAKQ